MIKVEEVYNERFIIGLSIYDAGWNRVEAKWRPCIYFWKWEILIG